MIFVFFTYIPKALENSENFKQGKRKVPERRIFPWECLTMVVTEKVTFSPSVIVLL